MRVNMVTSAPVQAACMNLKGDTVLQYRNHLSGSQVSDYPGGTLQCAGFLANASDYSSQDTLYFGTSIYDFQSQITTCTMMLRPGGLLVPNWNVNANLYGYLTAGTVLIGIVPNSTSPGTFEAATGQVFFIPQSYIYWIQNTGTTNAFIVLFYNTHNEIFSININMVFANTPESILNQGLIESLKDMKSSNTSEIIILVQNLNSNIPALSNNQNYLYPLEDSRRIEYTGAVAKWANMTTAFGGMQNWYPCALSLESLVLNPCALLVPSITMNANEVGYVISGHGKMGLYGCTNEEFDICAGDVFFIPAGAQHYIRNTGCENLVLIIAYSTNERLQTFFLDDYIQAIPHSGNVPVIQNAVTIVDPAGPNNVLATDNIEHIASDSIMNRVPGIEMAILLIITTMYNFVSY
uniref:Oxalate decarboxylase ARB_02208-like n=1 Tax=Geotrypetes seraphini TaxID=260995 RepID=A0A6P8PP18_GEOSA|nr:oxalate decarboxylase ARB_02208-like [Geotrypetes seraphini]